MTQIQSALTLYKEEGETPLEAVNRFKRRNPEYNDLPMTYAGRLDPMAQGLLLVLVGEECKKKEKYLRLDKEYELEVLFGFKTDTGDVLGKVVKSHSEGQSNQILDMDRIGKEVKSFKGKFVQEYPAFSSKTFNGEPLFELARKSSLPGVLPRRSVQIYSIVSLGWRKIAPDDLLKEIEIRIAKTKGDFRQPSIIGTWHESFRKRSNPEKSFEILKLKVSCSTGTYMRVLAGKIGDKVALPALAWSIKRTKIGPFKKADF